MQTDDSVQNAGWVGGRADALIGPVWLFSCVVGLILACLAGCEADRGGGAADYDHVYTVRARVLKLHDGSPSGEFQARHEAIPDYQAANGSVGMEAMQMPFQIVDFSVQEGVEVGDIVEITYGETHRPRVRQGVIAIRQLPNDTELDLGEETP